MPISSKEKRAVRIVCWAVCACLLLIYAFSFIQDKMTYGYWSFVHQKPAYYRRLSAACDAILEKHRTHTNSFLVVDPSDSSVAKIIHDLAPTKIKCSSNRVWMMIGVGHDGFGISWEPEPEGQTNVWALKTFNESSVRIISTMAKIY